VSARTGNGTTADPLVTYLLRLGDDNLVLAQRLGALVSWMPDVEEDVAVANLCLDHLGQARNLLTYAGEVEGEGRDEDTLAMTRNERELRNAVLVEQPNGDFGHTMARQLFLDAYQVPLYEQLASSTDATLAGIADKAVKEARYHLRYSSTWVVRLGDGTDESHRRMQAAIDALWPFTADLFAADEVEAELVARGIAADPAALRPRFDATVAEVLEQATLRAPTDPYQRLGGRQGFHTEHLGHLLPEMQALYRAHAGAQW
jgi:ring-1,2-phenylacetyl-CoA epoxidase subunit PaaC